MPGALFNHIVLTSVTIDRSPMIAKTTAPIVSRIQVASA
jgi:hypothetical protein